MTRPDAEARLRRDVRASSGLTIVTGGQTGIDTCGALAALAAGLPVHLIFPAGLRQEDGNLTPSRRAQLAGAVLHELPDESFRYRTWTCAYVSDAVLLLDPAGGSGCEETARAARHLGRPLLSPQPDLLTAELAASWLAATGARVLLVAGCRASVLRRAGQGGGLRTQLSRFMTGARQRHDLIAGPSG
jgi:predicted Rossmann fold nucleotide-binding protein DprA/Smf involved in DNA uptake